MSPLPPPNWNHPEIALSWPEAPEPARIEYMGVLRNPADLGRKPGWFERVKNAVFGTEPKSLLRPTAVARNAAGVLAVADPGLSVVHLFDLDRREYSQIGEQSASFLRSPIGVAVDDSGSIYVADSVLGRVFVFDASRDLVAELGEGELTRPVGVALDPSQEHLYVVDTIECEVVAFDLSSGRAVNRFGRRGVGPTEFNAPTYVAVARDGSISVSDSLNFRIQRFRPDGTPIASFGLPGDGAGHFARPKGVAIDTEGRIYVVDAGFENIQIFDPDGVLLLPFAGPGTGPGQFSLPGGLFIDSTNTIWVADAFNRRIQVFRLVEHAP
ncbi:MAG: SMP-30/gluconolactonase/LRE family protein [Deltaproteobacteria bacterium]|nr:SMP-30/gluconolactonase/LRE family protein [Deltaproteobacteria bacterium]